MFLINNAFKKKGSFRCRQITRKHAFSFICKTPCHVAYHVRSVPLMPPEQKVPPPALRPGLLRSGTFSTFRHWRTQTPSPSRPRPTWLGHCLSAAHITAEANQAAGLGRLPRLSCGHRQHEDSPQEQATPGDTLPTLPPRPFKTDPQRARATLVLPTRFLLRELPSLSPASSHVQLVK